MYYLIGKVIVGFIVGLIARAILPGNQSMGFIMTTILGIVGSLLASYAGEKFGLYHPGHPAGWIASVIGAIVVLLVVDQVTRLGKK